MPETSPRDGITRMRRKQSPKIGILGNNTFSTDAGMTQRRLESIPANTVNSVIKNIEVSLLESSTKCFIESSGSIREFGI